MLIGFVYLIDQDELLILVNSSVIYGGWFVGVYVFLLKVKFSYVFSYVCQSDYCCNFNCYSVDYVVGDIGFVIKLIVLGMGFEILGVSNGMVLISFQIFFVIGYRFNGWVDKFLVMFFNGLCSIYGLAGYGWKKVGKIDVIMFVVFYCCYNSDWVG